MSNTLKSAKRSNRKKVNIIKDSKNTKEEDVEGCLKMVHWKCPICEDVLEINKNRDRGTASKHMQSKHYAI